MHCYHVDLNGSGIASKGRLKNKFGKWQCSGFSVQGSGKEIDKDADKHAENPGNCLVTELMSHLHTEP